MIRMSFVLGGLLLLGGCATASQGPDLQRALAGESQVRGSALDRRIAAAARYPLGSRENPVRAEMPPGQQAYLRRLRCSDGRRPEFSRIGNFGIGVYGNIIDGYRVSCGAAGPGNVEVYMDMYHRGYVEARPVPGFTIAPF
jgi:hypothetical protein